MDRRICRSGIFVLDNRTDGAQVGRAGEPTPDPAPPEPTNVTTERYFRPAPDPHRGQSPLVPRTIHYGFLPGSTPETVASSAVCDHRAAPSEHVVATTRCISRSQSSSSVTLGDDLHGNVRNDIPGAEVASFPPGCPPAGGTWWPSPRVTAPVAPGIVNREVVMTAHLMRDNRDWAGGPKAAAAVVVPDQPSGATGAPPSDPPPRTILSGARGAAP